MQGTIALLLMGQTSLLFSQADTLPLWQMIELAEKHYEYEESIERQNEIHLHRKQQTKIPYLPQIQLNGEATYQSDVVSFPFELPMIDGLDLPYFRARAEGQVSQNLYDGGKKEIRQSIQKIENEIQVENIKSQRHPLRKQVAELYFRVLLIQNQQSLLSKDRSLLLEKQKLIHQNFEAGLVSKEEGLQLQGAILNIEKDSIQLAEQMKIVQEALSLLVDTAIDHFIFIQPKIDIDNLGPVRTSSSVKILDLQRQLLLDKNELSASLRFPKANLFARGGLGYPNPLNLLDNEISPFLIGGLQIQWPVWDWNRHSLEEQIIQLETENINTRMHQQKVKERIESLQAFREVKATENMFPVLEKLIKNQVEVRKLLSERLEKGLIGSSEYLDALHAEQSVKLQKLQLEIEWNKAKVEYLLENEMPLKIEL